MDEEGKIDDIELPLEYLVFLLKNPPFFQSVDLGMITLKDEDKKNFPL
jgi:hypothetical protein